MKRNTKPNHNLIDSEDASELVLDNILSAFDTGRGGGTGEPLVFLAMKGYYVPPNVPVAGVFLK